jgi:hypothetical protein
MRASEIDLIGRHGERTQWLMDRLDKSAGLDEGEEWVSPSDTS